MKVFRHVNSIHLASSATHIFSIAAQSGSAAALIGLLISRGFLQSRYRLAHTDKNHSVIYATSSINLISAGLSISFFYFAPHTLFGLACLKAAMAVPLISIGLLHTVLAERYGEKKVDNAGLVFLTNLIYCATAIAQILSFTPMFNIAFPLACLGAMYTLSQRYMMLSSTTQPTPRLRHSNAFTSECLKSIVFIASVATLPFTGYPALLTLALCSTAIGIYEKIATAKNQEMIPKFGTQPLHARG